MKRVVFSVVVLLASMQVFSQSGPVLIEDPKEAPTDQPGGGGNNPGSVFGDPNPTSPVYPTGVTRDPNTPCYNCGGYYGPWWTPTSPTTPQTPNNP